MYHALVTAAFDPGFRDDDGNDMKNTAPAVDHSKMRPSRARARKLFNFKRPLHNILI